MPLLGLWLAGVAVLNVAAHFLGQSSSGSSDTVSVVNDFLPLINYGTAGLLCLGFFSGRVVSSKQYEQAIKDRDRDHGELVALRQKLEDQILPGFIRMNDLSSRILDRSGHDDAPRPTPRRRSST